MVLHLNDVQKSNDGTINNASRQLASIRPNISYPQPDKTSARSPKAVLLVADGRAAFGVYFHDCQMYRHDVARWARPQRASDLHGDFSGFGHEPTLSFSPQVWICQHSKKMGTQIWVHVWET